MKVSKEIYGLSEEILDLFDPERLKTKDINVASKEQEYKPTDSKFDKAIKQQDKEEKIDEINDKNYEQYAQEEIHKMMGCNRDHAVEIDIYNKPFSEKILRIKMMKDEGNKAMGELSKNTDQQTQEDVLNKASYYYAQALLIFYYLIPDNEK